MSLQLWLKADYGVTTSGGAVSLWADQSGNARNFTQGTGAKQPAHSSTAGPNGLPRIQFDGAGDTLTCPAWAMASGAEGYFVIQDLKGAGVANYWNCFGSDAVNNSHCTFSDTHIYDSFGSTARKNLGVVSIKDRYHLYTSKSITNEWTGWVDGSQVFTTATNTVGWHATQFQLGESLNAGGFYWNGNICEVMIFSPVLSTANRQMMWKYLNEKWGLYA